MQLPASANIIAGGAPRFNLGALTRLPDTNTFLRAKVRSDVAVFATKKEAPTVPFGRQTGSVNIPTKAEGPQTFTELGLDRRVTQNLANLGLRVPTEVQQAALPVILSGKNAAIQSYTGSGKTLAYMLPILSQAIQRGEAELQRLAAERRQHMAGTLQAVVVAPSRELAMQIVRVGQSLLPPEARGCVQQAIGGANPYRQIEAIQTNRPLMIVGTPGRLAELSRSGVLLSHTCAVLVLDEVDQLLAPQFREDLVRLDQQVGRRVEGQRQTILVSATLSDKVLAQCSSYAPQAVPVRMSQERLMEPNPDANASSSPAWGWGRFGDSRSLDPGPTSGVGGVGTTDLIPAMPPGIEHGWLQTSRRHRVDATRRAIYAMNAQRALIFMNFQGRLQDTEAKLRAGRMKVATLSGIMSKVERQTILSKFKKGEFRALIVSDLMARGLDIEECDAVINLELPSDAAHYAHRAGRTGRAGRPGTVVSLVEHHEEFVIKKLAKRLNINIAMLEIANGAFQMPSSC